MWREISTAKFMTPEKKSAVLKPMKKKETFRFFSKLAKLVRDEKGQIVIMFTIMVPVIMGVIGLSLEVGRFYLLHSQLQDMAECGCDSLRFVTVITASHIPVSYHGHLHFADFTAIL